MSDLFSYTPKSAASQQEQRGNNAPIFSVAELSGALKKTIENTYGHVRVRGELSRVTVAKSGHMYSSLKDENAVLDAICWKGNMARLSVQPEEGMDVICTGRLTTYPGRSSYQLIIDTMELAGEGALLRMLEERKKKLAAEGLFHEDRKKPLPFLPEHIGIITSPTGAVIRDILHRISDRFPVHVTLWPVMVQGQGAATQIAHAVKGFNKLPANFKKPDLLIIARGGGSLEDLMPFNEENVVRAISDSTIPVISAVGHETDVTLCDFVADRRAPTPTGAAEMAVPVRKDLIYTVDNHVARMRKMIADRTQRAIDKVRENDTALKRFPRTLEQHTQRLDYATTSLPSYFKSYITRLDNAITRTASRLKTPQTLLHDTQMRLKSINIDHSFTNNLRHFETKLMTQTTRLSPPTYLLKEKKSSLDAHYKDFTKTQQKTIEQRLEKLHSMERLLETLSFKNILKRGYSVTKSADGKLIKNKKKAVEQSVLTIEFFDGEIKATPKQ